MLSCSLRLCRVAGMIAAVIAIGCFWATDSLQAQAEAPQGPLIRPLEFKTIKSKQLPDGNWQLKLAGKKNKKLKLPGGAIYDVTIRWRFKDLESFEMVVGGSDSFKATHVTQLKGYVQGLFLRVSLNYAKQPKKVQEFIDAKAKDFPKGRPWLYTHREIPIQTGSPEQLAAQKASVSMFFKSHILTMRKVDQLMRTKKKEAVDGKAFQKSGKFDAAAWESWLTKEVQNPLRQVQKSIFDAKFDVKFLDHQRDLNNYLEKLSRAYAKRSVERSKKLYKDLGLKNANSGVIPSGLNTNTRRFKNKDVKELERRLDESLNLELQKVTSGKSKDK